MLSRKNVKLMSQKQQPRKQRFGIRKLSIGVVSVLLGLLFIGGGQGALADDLAAASNAASTVSNLTTVESTSTAASTTASDQTVAASSASNDSSVASTVPAASTTDSVVSTPSSTNDVPTSQAVPSQQPTAPVVSDTPASTPVISDQPADSAVPDSQLPAVSAAPSVDSGASINSAAKEEVTENDTAAAVTPPAAAQPGNKEASQSGVQTVDKIHTDQILKDKYGIDVNHLDAKSVLLLASLFHIFANEANLGADMNGNVAVGILNSNVDFGTRGESINLTKGDIYYIQQLNAALQSGSFRNENFNHVIFGQDVNIEI
ncbi:MAG: YSIRK-type signal peptide-containing protein, partial [Limosilactobacillus sp.]